MREGTNARRESYSPNVSPPRRARNNFRNGTFNGVGESQANADDVRIARAVLFCRAARRTNLAAERFAGYRRLLSICVRAEKFLAALLLSCTPYGGRAPGKDEKRSPRRPQPETGTPEDPARSREEVKSERVCNATRHNSPNDHVDDDETMECRARSENRLRPATGWQ